MAKVTKAMKDDFERCEKLVNRIMATYNVEIPFLSWVFMTYEELLELEQELQEEQDS